MVPKNRPPIDWQAGQAEIEILVPAPGRDGHESVGQTTFVELPRVTIVIPARNEAENLPYVLTEIPTWVHEVILVDGHSTDDTIEVARRLLPNIRIVSQSRYGKGDALRLGFAASTGDIIVMLDADGSTDPKVIPAFISTLLSGADYAKGSRFLKGGGTADMGWLRQLGNGVFVLLVRLLFGSHYTDLCFGYNAFWKDILSQLSITADGFEIETEMNIQVRRANLWVDEVPCFEAERIFGKSNLRTVQDGWRVLHTIAQQSYQAYRQTVRAWLRSFDHQVDE
jgi:glycosyltransferase involved in cell wall biosynthesis